MDKERENDNVEHFVSSWVRERAPFAGWVRDVAHAYAESRLTVEGAAQLANTTPAELEAVLRLSTMDDDDLALLNAEVPSKTTWFLLAEATNDGIVAAVDALRERRGRPPSQTVVEVLRGIEGPPAAERIAALEAEVFSHLAKKAKQYDLLSPKSRKFLADIATRKKSGRPLTPKQIAYAQNLIEDLVAGGALMRPSPDGDQAIVDKVLAAVETA